MMKRTLTIGILLILGLTVMAAMPPGFDDPEPDPNLPETVGYTTGGAGGASATADVNYDSPSGCQLRAHYIHPSDHEPGRMNVEVATQCNSAVPSIIMTAQLYEKRDQSWVRIGDHGLFIAENTSSGNVYANDVCRKSWIKAVGLGEILDVDGDYYYAAVSSGPVYNPCNLP